MRIILSFLWHHKTPRMLLCPVFSFLSIAAPLYDYPPDAKNMHKKRILTGKNAAVPPLRALYIRLVS